MNSAAFVITGNSNTNNITAMSNSELSVLHTSLVERVSLRAPHVKKVLFTRPFPDNAVSSCPRSAFETKNDEPDQFLDAFTIAERLGLSVGTIRLAAGKGRLSPKGKVQSNGGKHRRNLYSLNEARRIFDHVVKYPVVDQLTDADGTTQLLSLEEIAGLTGAHLSAVRAAARRKKFRTFRKGRKLFAFYSEAEQALVPEYVKNLCERRMLRTEIQLLQLLLTDGIPSEPCE